MRKYILLAVLFLSAISALAVALLSKSNEGAERKESVWKYVSMRSVCYMSVECVTADMSPVQESIYTNRLMYGELPMSFVLTLETDSKDSISALACLVQCDNVKMESDLKDLKVDIVDGRRSVSGVFVYDLSSLSKELGVPSVMDMIKKFPEGAQISVKPSYADGGTSEYVKVKEK